MERPSPPSPRRGPLGIVDEFIGPGATRLELILQLLPLPFAAVLGYLHAHNAGLSASRSTIAGIFAFDLAGGVMTNSTSTAKRWYHREGQKFTNHMSFILVHLLHITLVAWLFRDSDYRFALITISILIVTASIILSVPRYVQRPVSLGLYLAIICAHATGLFGTTPGLQWFIPAFFLKLLVAHLLDETPFASELPEVSDEIPRPLRYDSI